VNHTARLGLLGLTIGYALAPTDSSDAVGLLKLADAAMYTGKQGGKFRVLRNPGDLALGSEVVNEPRP
jgi:GGDEF domain-containing protein